MPVPRLSIVIVSWNVRELLSRCLSSVITYGPSGTQIIVVDNASSDGSADLVQQKYPTVEVIKNSRNVGFAAGTNQGLAVATGEFILLLNPDTEIRDDAISPLIDFLTTQQRVAAIGPELLNPDSTHQVSVRRFPQLRDQFFVLMKMRRLERFIPALRRYYAEPPAGTPIAVDQIMGAAMLIPRAALTALGPLDDGFPNWFEEVDWCRRAHARGWRIMYAPISQVVHHGGSSFNQILSIAKHRWMLRGLLRYARRWWPTWQYPIVLVLAGVSYLLTVLQTIIKPR